MLYLIRLWLHKVLVLAEKRPVRSFRLRDASFDGKGVQAGIQEGKWQQLQDFVYPGATTPIIRCDRDEH